MVRLHPRCRVVWDNKRGAWAVIEKTFQGPVAMIAPLSTPPDMRVVDCLNEGSQARRMNRQEFEEWVHSLDPAAKDTLAADDRMAEGHDRLWHQLGTDTVVPIGGPNGAKTRCSQSD
jgi:hypothetical protein